MNIKKLFIIFSVITLLFASNICFAQTDLEVDYPELFGQDIETRTVPLPEYFKYIFNAIVFFSGLVAFLVLVKSGFQYLTSTGELAKMKDARDGIKSALLGVLIILSSYLILTTINPELVVLSLEKSDVADQTVLMLYTKTDFNTDEDNPEIAISKSSANLAGYTSKDIKSLKVVDKINGKLLDLSKYTIIIYEEENYQGDQQKITEKENSTLDFAPLSIEIRSKTPGVYLYTATNYEGEYQYFDVSKDHLESLDNPDIEDEGRSIEFEETEQRAILHKDRNFDGEVTIALENIADLSESGGLISIGDNVSSITLFTPDPEGDDNGKIYLCRNTFCEKEEYCMNGFVFLGECTDGNPADSDGGYWEEMDAKLEFDGFNDSKLFSVDGGEAYLKGDPDLHEHTWENSKDEKIEDNEDSGVSAITNEGGYMILLFEDTNYEGDCWIINNKSTTNLTDMGDEKISSMIVVKIK